MGCAVEWLLSQRVRFRYKHMRKRRGERERRVEREELFLQRREIRTLGEIDVVCFFMCNGKRRGRKLTRSLVYSIFLISFHFGKKKGREFSHLTPEQKHLCTLLNEHTHAFDTTTEMFFHHLYHHHHPCIERRLLL